MSHHRESIQSKLAVLYGHERAAELVGPLVARLDAFAAAHPPRPPLAPAERLTEDDVILITYGDQVCAEGEPPLHTLGHAIDDLFGGVVSGVHILPFYPYTSDDGFSVVDYTAVDPMLGSWEDLAPLRGRYRLMYDAVLNHISASSAWFKSFLLGEPEAEARFITLDPATDVSQVTRPRTHPLLTRFETADGDRWVWTTFSEDQIDINFANPEVLLAILDVVLFYVAQGADLLRLDAVGYIWKELGTRCIHLPQAHAIVQLLRSALDVAAPHVLLVTETNVPHADNISYFGDGTNEAQMVYQFPLAPLVLNAFQAGAATHLTRWASGLAAPTAQTTFFNFLASHDGIGVVPASGILSNDEVDALVLQALEHGGRVSYKTNPDGTQSPYELNITLFDMLSNPASADPYAIDRMVCANAIMLALQGVPGVYVHSLVGSHNNLLGLASTGRARTINREKWSYEALRQQLAEPGGRAATVLARMSRLIQARRHMRAFHPNSPQKVLAGDPAVFSLLRGGDDAAPLVLCLHNVSALPHELSLTAARLGFDDGASLVDMLGGAHYRPSGDGLLRITLAPYQVLWLGAE
ncbi:sugar phosphorylase [Chloroflexia bacterium SDU3-3]|nr:sugar phosphorylase [Chloroflexia bacterium SDU3-3]